MNERETQEIYRNIERDEATTGRSGLRLNEQPGLANEDEPQWRPLESDPEPRPVEPMMAETDATSLDQ